MHQPSTVTQFRWDNSYAERLPGFYVFCAPSVVPNPVLLRFNSPLAEELGLNAGKLDSSLAAQIFSGTELPAGAQPLAQWRRPMQGINSVVLYRSWEMDVHCCWAR